MKPRMIVFFGLITFLALVSACKPESESRPAQQTSTTPAPLLPTATVANVAPAVTVTATKNRPPACQFNSTAIAAIPSLTESYTFSEPRVAYTTRPGGLFIYGWSSDSRQLLVNGYNYDSDRYTLVALDAQTGTTRVYAERQAPGWAAWVPGQHAVAYADSENLSQSGGAYRDDLWISQGSPQQATRMATGADAESLAIDPAGRLTFFPRERGGQPLNLRLQQYDVTTRVKQGLPFDLSQWAFPQYAQRQDESATDSSSRRFRAVWRPGTASQVLLYFVGMGLQLVDTQTGQICEIKLRQENQSLTGSRIAWSPDGRYLAMAVRPAFLDQQPGHLMIIDMNTGQQSFPDLGSGDLVDIKWGASSHQVAALMQVVVNDGRDAYRLYLIDAGSQAVQRVLPEATLGGGGSGSGEMSWSPDGKLLAINCPNWQDDQVMVAARVCLISTSQTP